jgi:uncharacterized protein YbgA (DUF1722 family)/uncharacterized protein YbbK (DUF523 family)
VPSPTSRDSRAATRAAPLRLGVSACLLGEAVRYDGGHKRDRFVTDVLGGCVEWVPVCPELEAGLGVPRPAMRLTRDGGGVRVVEIGSGRDHTQALRRFSASRIRALRALNLSGYVLKADSPSCGMARVRVYGRSGPPQRRGRGVFAEALLDALPELPVEEEGRLQDPALRENFIERLFAYRRLRDLLDGRASPGRIAAFHTAHELQLTAHSQEAARSLGRLVAGVKRIPPAELRARYAPAFMAALSRLATRGRNRNALQHAAGHLKGLLDPAGRAELAVRIEDYRKGLVPLVVPITLLRHHARAHAVAYLEVQTFLDPHPQERMLRNRV